MRALLVAVLVLLALGQAGAAGPLDAAPYAPPWYYRLSVSYDPVQFSGGVPYAPDANGTLAGEGVLRGYVRGAGLGMNLRAAYEGALERDASGGIVRDEVRVRVWDIDLGETRARVRERVTYAPALQDVPDNWTMGHAWEQPIRYTRLFERDGRTVFDTDEPRDFHFEVVGTREMTFGDRTYQAFAVMEDTEPMDTDGSYNVTWFAEGTSFLLAKGRYVGGIEVANATLLAIAPKPPGDTGVPAPGAAWVAGAVAAALGLKRLASRPLPRGSSSRGSSRGPWPPRW